MSEASDDIKKHAEAVIYNNEGCVLYREGKYKEAAVKYQQALEACPSVRIASINNYKKNLAISFQCLGSECHKQKKYEEAKDFYNKAHKKSIECFESDTNYENFMKLAEAAIFKLEGDSVYKEKKTAESLKSTKI